MSAHPAPEWQAVPGQDRKAGAAPSGQVFVCAACGKTSKSIYQGPRGWDESCAMNAVLCYEPRGSTGPATGGTS